METLSLIYTVVTNFTETNDKEQVFISVWLHLKGNAIYFH